MINAGTSEFMVNKFNFWSNPILKIGHDGDDSGASDAAVLLSQNLRGGDPIDGWLAGEWHYIEVHWDSTVADPYLALVIDDQFPLVEKLNTDNEKLAIESGGTEAAKLFFGKSSAGNGDGMDATLDEFKIYDSPTIDLSNLHQRYVDKTRNDNTVQSHEHGSSSYDVAKLADSIAVGDDLVFYQKPPYVTITPNTLPVLSEVKSTMEYKAAKGETISLFFNVYSRVNAASTTVSIDNNKFANGSNTLPANPTTPEEILDIRVVKNRWQAGTADWGSSPEWGAYLPEILVNDATASIDISAWSTGAKAVDNGGVTEIVPIDAELPSFDLGTSAVDAKLDLAAHSSTQFVITVEIPDNAAAGTYTATVSFENGSVSEDLTIELDVLDFALAANEKETSIYHRALFDPFSCYRNDDTADHCNDLLTTTRYQAQIDDIGSHGFNSIFTYNDPEDLTDAGDQVQQLIDAGIDKRISFGQAHPDQNWGVYSNDAAQAMYDAGLTPSFYGYDEPGFRNLLTSHLKSLNTVQNMTVTDQGQTVNAGAEVVNAIFRNVAICLRDGVNNLVDSGCETPSVLDNLLPTHPSKVVDAPDCTTQNPNGDVICDPPYYPQLDVENIQTEELSTDTQDYYIDLMNGTTTPPTYQLAYWQSRVEDPRLNRYYAGFFLYLTDIDGFMPYVYHQLTKTHHPYDDFIQTYSNNQPKRSRQHMTTYPSQDGPIATIQWEALRDGLNDSRYLETWEDAYSIIAITDASVAATSKTAIDNAMAKYKLGRVSVLANVSIDQFNTDRETIQDEIVTLLSHDQDGDGLPDIEEYQASNQTDWTDSDSDNDGLSDGAEVNTHSTDPNDADSDDDGLNDGPEVNTHSTNPNDDDSDDDWLKDGYEVNTFSSNPNDIDSDDDGLWDFGEAFYGADPNDIDTDNDWLQDGYEVNTSGTSPTNADTDGDGYNDFNELLNGWDPLDDMSP